MDLTNQGFWIDFILPIVQTIILAGTLLYLAWQTRSMQQSIRLNGEISLSTQTKDINQYLLDDPELLSLIGYSKEKVFAFMLLNSLELRHRLHKDKIFSEKNWCAQLQVMDEIARLPVVQEVWAEKEEQYDPDFRKDFQAVIKRHKLSTAPKVLDGTSRK